MLDEQLDRAGERERDELGAEVQPESRARGALLRQPELLGRSIDAARLEARALERDARGARPDLGVGAAEDARDAERALLVGDDQDVRREQPVDTVECPQRLACPRATSHERLPLQLVRVVRVERLPELEHHVVRDVDGVVDRPHPRCAESLLHVLEVGNPEPPAAVGILDADG